MSRSVLVLESSVVLQLCSSAAALSHLWKQGPLDFEMATVALLVPSVATALFLCVSAAVPDLYAVGSLKPPITITLPLIHSAILLLSTVLLSKIGLSISTVPDRLTSITIWLNPLLLFLTFVAGVICLTVLGVLAKERPER